MKKNLTSAILSAAVLSSAIAAQAAQRDIVTYDAAAKGVAACVKLASEKDWAVSVVVVDRGDNVVSSARMTEALSASYTGASLKASSSLAWAMPTGAIEGFVADKPQFRAFPGLLTIEGGAPVMSASKTLIGAVGVAGSSPSNDAACAAAAVDAMAE